MYRYLLSDKFWERYSISQLIKSVSKAYISELTLSEDDEIDFGAEMPIT